MEFWSAGAIRELTREPGPSDDKYSRGVLGVFTGSLEYPGAAVLGCEAAARSGVGLIRYLGAARELVLAARPEVVTVPGRVSAWLIGSGVPELSADDPVLDALEAFAGPIVLDAGALTAPVLDRLRGGRLLLTPHSGEAARLLGAPRADVEADRAAAARELAERFAATVLLKGARSLIAHSGGVRELPAASGRLATAGSGDVLGGLLGGLAAQHPELEPLELATAAAWLHDAAAKRASAGAPVPALEIARAVTGVLREVAE